MNIDANREPAQLVRATKQVGQPIDVVISRITSMILRVGVTASAAALAVGLVLAILPAANRPLSQSLGTSADWSSVVLAARSHGLHVSPELLIGLGVLLLLATPIARVAASIAIFAAGKDWLYSAITAVVLAILITSIFVLH